MSGTRSAFVVANDAYSDGRLRQLRAPAADAEELARVLSDADIGGFDDVSVSMNEPEHVVRRKLSAFFDDRGLDDLLVLHLSCHGLKDDDGRLYFATADTDVDHLDATSIPSEFVNRQMTRSRSRRIILLLDCCYSGAFAAGLLSRGGDRVDIKERFDGRGRVVLTASSAMEYSFEGDTIAGEGRPSVFTSALVRGLATGEADRNGDGWISVDELYDYAYDQVRAATPSQTPGKWVFDVQGDLIVARSVIEPAEPEPPVPAELTGATKSPFAHVRAGAAEELRGLLASDDEGVRDAAREALEALVGDDSNRVSVAASRALGGPVEVEPEGAAPEPAPPPVAQAAPPPPPVPPEAPAAPGAAGLGRIGAVVLLAALIVPLLARNDYVLFFTTAGTGYTSYESWNSFAVLSPFEALGVAAAAWIVASAARAGRVGTVFASGVLLALGVLSTVAAIGLVRFCVHRLGAAEIVCAVVALAGAVAILAAGVMCVRAWPTSAAATKFDPGALLLTLAGAGLALIALFVNYDGYSSLWSEVGEGTSAEFFFEPALAVVVMLAGVVALGARPRFASGMLLAVGGATALHYLGVSVAAWRAIGEVGSVRPAGFIGLAGGLLVAASGIYVYTQTRATREPQIQ